MSLVVATWNVLAPAFAVASRYPHCDPDHLDARERVPALAEHVAGLGADIVCLQEVETATYCAMEGRLRPLGYYGEVAMKGGDRPDGCAVFVQRTVVAPQRFVRVEFDDGDDERPGSGHVALLGVLRHGERRLGVVNTHLKWDPPDAAPGRRYGIRQVRELLAACRRYARGCEGWIVCGDLNVTPDSEVIALLRDNGFVPAHAATVATCNPHRRAKQIDYVLHDAAFDAEAIAPAPVHDDTPLPGPGQPSDHVALLARLAWRAPR